MANEKVVAAAERNEIVAKGFADVEEAMAFLGLSRAKIYGLMDDGSLRFAKFGRAKRILRRALEKYAVSCMVGA
jgi:excisionase family DNA binding protein